MNNDFGTWLTTQLETKGLSQADLSKKSGMSPAQISRLVNGVRGVGEDSILAIANALNIPPETVFRAAGLLPPVPDCDSRAVDLAYQIAQLDPDDQQIIDTLISTMIQRREKREEPTRSHKPLQATD